MLTYDNCTLCGRKCGINRNTVVSTCNSNSQMRIARYALHPFEEPPITGTNGSGTVFFCGCPLRCVFCQNIKISRKPCGKIIDEQELSNIFIELEHMGAANINLVNPTHFVPSVLKALETKKIKIPVVYNTHGYDSIETLNGLKGHIDIYLPDIKYFDDYYAIKYSQANNYFAVASEAVKNMCGQVENKFDENGIMKSGVIIRHLVLPQMSSESIKILEWIKNELPKDTIVSLMAQYTPYNDLEKFPELQRKITRREYDRVVDKMIQLDIKGYIQEISSSDKMYIPEWNLVK